MIKNAAKAVPSARRTPARTVAKSAVESAARSAPKAVPKAVARKPATAAPSIRFYHSEALRAKTHAVLGALEAAPEHARHRDAVADLVAELIEAGMDYYFMRALERVKMGFVAEQSARISLSGAVRLISSVNRKFIVGMNPQQLLIVAQHLRELG